MSLFMEIETDRKLPFDARKIAELVIETSLDYVKCPYAGSYTHLTLPTTSRV